MSQPASEPTEPTHDIVVFGATSFVGEILCRYLVERHGTDGDVRWAIAGRNRDKLAEVASRTGAKVPQIIADAKSPADMQALAAGAQVVVSTVGPYALYGSDLVAAVAETGGAYCDLTGEAHWIRRMIDAHHDQAVARGARIVHACGFDSIPSDLGVWFTQQQAMEQFGEYCTSISTRVKAMKGGASGGTIASMLNLAEEVTRDPSLRKVLGNPYALAPEDFRQGARQPDVVRPQRDPATGEWIAPFVMSAINTRVVHRTHALLGRPWGDAFTYDEAMTMGEGASAAVKAAGVTAGLAGALGVAAIGPVRRFVGRKVVPQPGEGPSPEAQASGYFDFRLYGRTKDGRTITTKVTGDRDPGYGSTAKMLGEAAHALVEMPPAEVGRGILTPATAFGDELIARLTAHAGLTFEVL